MSFWDKIADIFNFVPTILITILLFGILIFVHELGHYIAARAFGVGVDEFSLGMGPKIFSIKGKYNPFTVRWLPIGGYVSMIGETDEEQDPERAKVALNRKPRWQRCIVMLAGVFMNFMLAFLVMFFIVVSSDRFASTKIAVFNDNATSNQGPTDENRLMADDEIIEVNGSRVYVYFDMAYKIMSDGIEPVDLVVKRGGREVKLTDVVFPETTSQGVLFGDIDFKVYGLENNFKETLYQTFFQPLSIFRVTVGSLGDAISGRYGIQGVSGPVGITSQVGEAASSGLAPLASLLVMLSMSIAVFNLLPGTRARRRPGTAADNRIDHTQAAAQKDRKHGYSREHGVASAAYFCSYRKGYFGVVHMIKRRITKAVRIGSVTIGNGERIAVQSMTNTETADKIATLSQINSLAECGCDIVRMTVNTGEAAENVGWLVERSPVPLVARHTLRLPPRDQMRRKRHT